MPARLPWVVLDEFLVAQELDHLMRFTGSRAASFRVSEVLAGKDDSAMDEMSRCSRVLFDLEGFGSLFRQRILWSLPYVLACLGLAPFAVNEVEVQLTATHDGGFFRPHFDDHETWGLGRRVTFVYYFFREPRRFGGGELRLFSGLAPELHTHGLTNWRIPPQQNQIVFFDSRRLHEVMPVRCPSPDFRDGRFTVNGWIHGSRTALR